MIKNVSISMEREFDKGNWPAQEGSPDEEPTCVEV